MGIRRDATHLSALVLFLTSLASGPAWAQQPAPAEPPAPAAEEPATPPPVAEEVNGTCATPRQAWLQLLYWMQVGTRWEPGKSAACFDTSRLTDPVSEAPRLAEMLKESVDAHGALVDVDALPFDPDYVDKLSGEARYENPHIKTSLPGIVVAKGEDGRWLFTPETLDLIPDLPRPSADAKAEPETPAKPTANETKGDAKAASAEPAAAPAKASLPPIEDEVQGTCLTARQAWLQLLYWLQKGTRWNPKKAAICFDTSELSNPQKRAPQLAEMLKEAIDAKSALVAVDDAPTDPNYVDPNNGLARYEDPEVRNTFAGVYVVKKGNRWLFSADTLRGIPDMVPATYGLRKHLPDWMQGTLLGVEIWSYFGIIVLIFLALLFQKIVVFVIGTYMRRLVGKTKFTYLRKAIHRADRPIGGLVMAVVFYFGFPLLLFPVKISKVAMVATEALAAYSVVWLAYRLIDVVADFMEAKAEKTETKLDDQLVPLVVKSLKVFVSVVGGIFILQNLDVNVGSLLAGLGLGGLAFALAAKDTVANFFGSVMIFVDKPFQIGDWVVVSGAEGIIEEVGFRTSRIRTFYNSQITVPNANLVNSVIDNFGRRRYRRYVSTLGLTYDTPPEKVQAFCEGVRAIIAGMPGMRKDYYMVEFKDFGGSSLEIMLYCFMVAPTWNDELRIRSNLNLEIMRLAKRLGVSFAFPTQTVHVETLANLGESRPSHSGPTETTELAAVVDGFGPNGELAKPKSVEISKGYDCRTRWVATETGDADGDG